MPKLHDDQRSIFVVNHGWPTAIVIPRQPVDCELSFLKQEFSKVKCYEFGLGE